MNAEKNDDLTGLPGLGALATYCQMAIDRAEGTNKKMALHVIHIYGLKEMVMEQGLLSAELVLKAASNRLYGLFQQDKKLARLEGENLGLFQADADQKGYVLYVARRAIECLSDLVEFPEGSVTLPVSVGTALFPDHGCCWEEIYSAALQALDHAMQEGPGKAIICQDICPDICESHSEP